MKRFSTIQLTAPLAAAVVLVTGGVLASASQRGTPQAEPAPPALAAPSAKVPTASRSLTELKQGADLVFQGEVIGIRYAMSEDAGPGRNSLPHTFVTYRVLTLLRGVIPDPVITLRFIGGVDPTTGLYLRASNNPQFDIGDNDILFVRGNGQSMCPLVKQYEGRLRVIDGRVYTEMGHEVTLGERNDLRVGRRHAFEQVRTTRVGNTINEIDLGPQAVMGPSNAEYVEVVLHAIASIPDQRRNQETAFVSVDPSAPFVGPDFSPVAPPKDQAGVVTLTPEDREELENLPDSERSVVRTKTKRDRQRTQEREKEGDKDG